MLADIVASATEFTNITGQPYDPAQVAVLVDDTSVNAERQTARGVDALFTYRVRFGDNAGSLLTSVDASYLDSDQQVSSAQPVLPLAGVIFNPPHFRARGGTSWDAGSWDLTGYINYTGSVRDTRFTPPARLHSLTTVDLSARVRSKGSGLFGGLQLSLSILNLLNAKPEGFDTTLFSQTPYDSTNYSPVGRFVAFALTKKW